MKSIYRLDFFKNPNIQAINLPSLLSADSLYIYSNDLLYSISMNLLTQVNQQLYIGDDIDVSRQNPVLHEINLQQLITVNGTSNLQYVEICNIPNLQEICTIIP